MVVTTADLANKTCWICAEEESAESDAASTSTISQHASFASSAAAAAAASSSVAAAAGSNQSGKKTWCHPCQCSMVAHEACLLQWIQIERSRPGHTSFEAISCPSCKTRYILHEPKPLALRFFRLVDEVTSLVVPVAAAATVGAGVLVASTAYSCVAVRLILGREGAARALARPWPKHYYFDLPLLPFALIASRLPLFEAASVWLPTLIAFPATHLPLRNASWVLMHPYGHPVDPRRYPPSPAMMALIVPWARALYFAIKRRVYRAILGRFLKRSNSSTSSAAQPRRRRRQRVIIVGAENRLEDAEEPVAGAAAIEEEILGPAEGGNDDDLEVRQTIYVTHQSLGRLCLGALSFPAVASVMGSALERMAGYSSWLSKFLGMDTMKIRLGKKGGAIGTSPFAALWSGGLSTSDLSSQDQGLFGNYDDLDPVWYRNLVGAGLFVVCKDALVLLYRYLRLRQRGKLRIADRPFAPSIAQGLKLKNPSQSDQNGATAAASTSSSS